MKNLMKISVIAIFLALSQTVSASIDTVFVNGVDTSNTLPTGFSPVDTNSYIGSVVTEVVDLDTTGVFLRGNNVKFIHRSMKNYSTVTFGLYRAGTSFTGDIRVELNGNTVIFFDDGGLELSPYNDSFNSTLTINNSDNFVVTSSGGGRVLVDCRVTHNETTFDTLVVISIDKPSSVSTSENFGSSVELTLFPNPVVDRLNIRFDNTPFDVTFRIINMNGQVVLEDVLNDNSINVSELKTDNYLLQLQTENGKFYRQQFTKD